MQRRTIEEELAVSGRALSWTEGVSMEPLLHTRRSTVVLEPVKKPLKRYDVVLFRRPAGEYVLHRIVKVLDHAYRIRGDNCYWTETVPAGWIVGVMTGFFQDEGNVYIDCSSPVYQNYLKTIRRRYVVLRMRSFPKRIRERLGRILRMCRS